MIPSYDHYRAGKRRRRKRRLATVAALAGVALLAALGAVFRVDRLLYRAPGSRHTLAELGQLWKAGRYDELLAASDAMLKADPLAPGVLAYRGFAAFYRAVSATSAEEKAPWIDESIASLRRARLASNALAAETDYVLAKAYYHRGKYAYDQVIRYMDEALNRGFVQSDSYEYLGMAWTQLGDYEKALAAFLEALKQEPTDILLLTIGQTYYQMKHTGEAVEYLLRALNKTEDKAIERQARLKLGEIYLDQGELFKAEESFQALVELDPRSADAHFFLGEVYDRLKDVARSRAEWRAALRLDPNHYGARLRYYARR